jgi:hypothetical protein
LRFDFDQIHRRVAVATIRRVRNVVEAKAFTDATAVSRPMDDATAVSRQSIYQASGSGDYLSNHAVGSQSEMNILHLIGAGRSLQAIAGRTSGSPEPRPKLRQINRIFSVLFKLILDPEE